MEQEVEIAGEVIDIPDNDETNAVATKLQAVQRVKLARQEVEAKKKAKTDYPGEAPVSQVYFHQASARGEAIDVHPDNAEANDSATKVRPSSRTKKAQREVGEKRRATKERGSKELADPADKTIEHLQRKHSRIPPQQKSSSHDLAEKDELWPDSPSALKHSGLTCDRDRDVDPSTNAEDRGSWWSWLGVSLLSCCVGRDFV